MRQVKRLKDRIELAENYDGCEWQRLGTVKEENGLSGFDRVTMMTYYEMYDNNRRAASSGYRESCKDLRDCGLITSRLTMLTSKNSTSWEQRT